SRSATASAGFGRPSICRREPRPGRGCRTRLECRWLRCRSRHRGIRECRSSPNPARAEQTAWRVMGFSGRVTSRRKDRPLSALDAVTLLIAGVLGGLTGSIAGLASVATYPALLAIGLPPVTANVTNTVALVFNAVGSAWGSRPELTGQGRFIIRGAP